MQVTREQFIELLTDCKGYSAQEASELAVEYQNNLGDLIKDWGGDESSIEEAKAYLQI